MRKSLCLGLCLLMGIMLYGIKNSGSSQKVGGENRAQQRNVNSMEEKIALLSTHISFFARSLMAKPCNLLPLWTCIPPKIP